MESAFSLMLFFYANSGGKVCLGKSDQRLLCSQPHPRKQYNGSRSARRKAEIFANQSRRPRPAETIGSFAKATCGIDYRASLPHVKRIFALDEHHRRQYNHRASFRFFPSISALSFQTTIEGMQNKINNLLDSLQSVSASRSSLHSSLYTPRQMFFYLAQLFLGQASGRGCMA